MKNILAFLTLFGCIGLFGSQGQSPLEIIKENVKPKDIVYNGINAIVIQTSKNMDDRYKKINTLLESKHFSFNLFCGALNKTQLKENCNHIDCSVIFLKNLNDHIDILPNQKPCVIFISSDKTNEQFKNDFCSRFKMTRGGTYGFFDINTIEGRDSHKWAYRKFVFQTCIVAPTLLILLFGGLFWLNAR